MTRNGKILTGAGLSFAILAACDGSDGAFGNPASQFGEIFAAAFAAAPTATPSEDLTIAYLGVQGVNLTAEPVDF